MKQSMIIAWPHANTTVEQIRELISKDGYLVLEEYKGNKESIWNPKKEEYQLFIVGSNSHLLISNILGELTKHLCLRAKGIENEEKIKEIIEFTLGVKKKAPEKKK